MRNAKEAKAQLIKLGWAKPFLDKSEANLFQGVLEMQRGFGFGHLVPDGDPGDLTLSAMEHSVGLGGACTENFAYREFQSRYGIIRLHRDLPRGLEEVRKISGPIHIINGYRDPRHNREIGGASRSVHLSGAAVDATLPHIKQVLALGIFSGVGATINDEITRHVDLRNIDQWSTRNGGTPKQPAMWGYKARGGTTGALKRWYSYPTNGPGLPVLGTWKIAGSSAPKPKPKPKPKPAATAKHEPAPKFMNEEDTKLKGLRTRVIQVEREVRAIKAELG